MIALLKPLFQPIFADVIGSRPLALIVAGAGALQLGLSCTLHVGFPCAFHSLTGLPCPGCGLTRSVLALGQGRLHDSFELHPFGILLAVGLVGALVVGMLPAESRRRVVSVVGRFETRTGITMILFLAFMLLWGLRVTGVVHLAAV